MSNVQQATGSPVSNGAGAVKTNAISGRTAALSAIVGFVLGTLSGFLFFAAEGFSNADPKTLLVAGGNSADIFRWASLVDLFGYLVMAPLVVYLYYRFRDDPQIVLYTAAGFAFILIGAIGATIFLKAGPMLLRDYASATGAQRASITTTFTTLYQVVVVGLWQTLEGIPGGVWLFGVGKNLYRDNHRVLSILAFAFGGLLLILAAIRILGF